jgi:hypothetical protein
MLGAGYKMLPDFDADGRQDTLISDVFEKLTAVEIEVAGDFVAHGFAANSFPHGDPPLDSYRRLRRVARRPVSRVELHHRKYRWVILVTNWDTELK